MHGKNIQLPQQLRQYLTSWALMPYNSSSVATCMKSSVQCVLIFLFAASLLQLLFGSLPVYASDDPLAVPNNKFGIHILFQHELTQAAKLVNTNGGDWGYVIIPIQAGDRDIVKWQSFMDEAKLLH